MADSARPLSLAVPSSSRILSELDSQLSHPNLMEVDSSPCGNPDISKTRFHTDMKLRRAKSSTLAENLPQQKLVKGI